MLKFFKVLVLISLVFLPQLRANPISKDCKFKGIKLYGEFQIVEYSPDIRVEIVNHGSDLRVQKVNFTPSRCGEWRLSKRADAIRVQLVTYSPDIRVEWSNFPGLSK